jgi:hypothetical protein
VAGSDYHENVEALGIVTGSNGSPTSGQAFKVTVPVGGFDRNNIVHIAPTLFRIQAQKGGWSEDEITLWVKQKVFGFMRQQYSVDAHSQFGEVIAVPSDILFVGYKPKG